MFTESLICKRSKFCIYNLYSAYNMFNCWFPVSCQFHIPYQRVRLSHSCVFIFTREGTFVLLNTGPLLRLNIASRCCDPIIVLSIYDDAFFFGIFCFIREFHRVAYFNPAWLSRYSASSPMSCQNMEIYATFEVQLSYF